MGVIPFDLYHHHPPPKELHVHGPVVEEIQGLIRVYKDGHVDRPSAIPEVPASWSPDPDVFSCDSQVTPSAGVWVRTYVPIRPALQLLLPVLVYFHGGGFCVGSAAWRCYHEFLSKLALKVNCVVVSVNYRLSPEHRLPAAFDDGVATLRWLLHQQSLSRNPKTTDENSGWRNYCNFSKLFIGGDSAGGNIAYNVALQINQKLQGLILIQPFFGAEKRTVTEKSLPQPPRSPLTLSSSDCYWRLSLPAGKNRDNRWCNPLSGKNSLSSDEIRALPPMIVCISELDILRDRNLEFCKAVRRTGKKVEQVVFAGVGHAFQVLDNSRMAQTRTAEMLSYVKAFMANNR